jgi:5-bromo-4-chloroindolyl phosphate hydrolysis protein
MPPKQPSKSSLTTWILGAMFSIVLLLVGFIANDTRGNVSNLRTDQQITAKELHAHELLDGHSGTLAELKAMRRELEQFRQEFRDYAKSHP